MSWSPIITNDSHPIPLNPSYYKGYSCFVSIGKPTKMDFCLKNQLFYNFDYFDLIFTPNKFTIKWRYWIDIGWVPTNLDTNAKTRRYFAWLVFLRSGYECENLYYFCQEDYQWDYWMWMWISFIRNYFCPSIDMVNFN